MTSTKLRDFQLSQDDRFSSLDQRTQESIQSLALTLQEAHTKLDQVLRRSSAEQLQLMQNESQTFANARELDRRIDSMLLESLRFSTMNYGQEDICEAYQSTYKWVLKEPKPDSHQPWSSLMQWLKTGGGLYWVNGKAGRGSQR